MPDVRTELLPGVWLNYFYSDKFKSSHLSLSLLTQLQRETASLSALVPVVLHRGTQTYPDMEKVSARLDELYGSVLEPVIRRMGEIQCVGFYASFPEAAFLPQKKGVFREIAALMGEMLLHPITRGGLLLPAYVDSEKKKMADAIRSRVNEKRAYALVRCMEEMCCYEDYSVGRLGSAEDCENVNYKKLTKHYHSLLQTSPIEIYYCGREKPEEVIRVLKDVFSTLPRGEINYDIGTDIRMNSIDPEPRYYEEEMDVNQGKLVLGFRLGQSMECPDWAALSVFNSVFGNGSTSKLFMNVREKLSLCYYASSVIDMHKGILLVSSGIDFAKFDAAKAEILHQLSEVKDGNITDEEMASAKAGIISDCHAMLDSPMEMEGFTLSHIIDGDDITPEQLCENISLVSKEQISAIASGVELDLIYFLKGKETDEEDDEN